MVVMTNGVLYNRQWRRAAEITPSPSCLLAKA